jgi:hypothetical protein
MTLDETNTFFLSMMPARLIVPSFYKSAIPPILENKNPSTPVAFKLVSLILYSMASSSFSNL